MASIQQIEANRANARRSTGPVTPEGKARVAQNALKHGLTSRHFIVRDDEMEEFEQLRDSLQNQTEPETPLEGIAFNELLHAAWNLRRFRRLEAEAYSGSLEDFKNGETAALLERISRYQTRAQRAYSRALAELRQLQTARVLHLLTMDEVLRAEMPPMADIERLAKQSQWSSVSRTIDAHQQPGKLPPDMARGLSRGKEVAF